MNTINKRIAPLMVVVGLAGLLTACGSSNVADVGASKALVPTQTIAQTDAPVATVTAQAPAAAVEAVVSQTPAQTTTTMVTSAPTPAPQTNLGRASLSWTPPTENTDGSALANLSGYRVYYGSSASSLTNKVELSNAGLTAYVIENLPAGTTYFAIAAVNAAGVESALSGVGSKTI